MFIQIPNSPSTSSHSTLRASDPMGSGPRGRFQIHSSGQVMLLTVMILSSGLLSASIVAGMIVLLQLRQTIDVMESTRAAYAADTVLECALYKQFQAPVFECDDNGVIAGCFVDINGNTNCQLANGSAFSVAVTPAVPPDPPTIKSVGEFGDSARAFEARFTILTQCNDSVDNEAVPDGFVDYPSDSECISVLDTDETTL